MNNPTPIVGSVNEKGIFTAKNPYSLFQSQHLLFRKEHPQLLTYTPSNVLVTDQEHVEVTGPHWLALIYGKLQIASNTDWKSFQQLKDYWGDRAECKEGYLLVENSLTDAKPFKAVDEPDNIIHNYKCDSCGKELKSDMVRSFCPRCFSDRFNEVYTIPEAQPLDGGKTAEANVNPFEKHLELAASIEHAANYWKADSKWTNHLFRINQLCLEYEELEAQFATDAGGVDIDAMAKDRYPNHRQSDFDRGGVIGFITGYKQTLSAPSTHSSSEMVEESPWISVTNDLPKNKNWVLGKHENNRRQIVSYHPSYKHWVNEDGNKIKGIKFWTQMPI